METESKLMDVIDEAGNLGQGSVVEEFRRRFVLEGGSLSELDGLVGGLNNLDYLIEVLTAARGEIAKILEAR